MQRQKPKLLEASNTRRSKAMEDLERLGMKGLKVALILAQLGYVAPLVGLLDVSELIVRQGENLVRGVYGHKERISRQEG